MDMHTLKTIKYTKILNENLKMKYKESLNIK